MTIKSLYVGHFGKLKDVQINLHDGLNIVYGENESGKSTLQGFIKAMFYGMNSQKKDIKENPRLHYIPWGKEKAFGELYFSDKYHNQYLVKRSFGKRKRDDQSQVLNVITGEEVPYINEGKPGEELLGLGEGAFERTVWIKQLGVGVYQDKDDELIGRLTNLHESGDENISYKKAMEGLNEARKTLTNQRKTGKLDKLKDRYTELLQELRDSNFRYHDSIEDELQLKTINKQRLQLIDEINRIDDIRKKRGSYDQWIELKNKINEKTLQRDALLEKSRELKSLILRYKGFESLDEEEIHKIIDAINHKKYLEEKLKAYDDYVKELNESEDELHKFSMSLGQIEKFSQVDKTMELEINRLENSIKEHQYRWGQSGKKDSLNIRKEILMDKNKTLTMGSLLSVLLILGGFSGGMMYNQLCYGLIPVGLIILVLTINSKKNNHNKINKIQNQIKALDNQGSVEDINEMKDRLKHLYGALNVSDYEEFIEGLRIYEENKSKLEALKVKAKEKGLMLDRMDKHQVETALTQSNKYIQDRYNLYDCYSVKELNSKLKEYNELISEERNLKRELLKINETLELYNNDLKNFEEKSYLKLEQFNEEPLEEEAINQLSRDLQEKLIDMEKKLKDIQYAIEISFLNHRHPTEVQEELSFVKEKMAEYDKNIRTIDLSSKVLQESFQEMQRNFGPRLNRRVSDVLGEITKGRYNELKVSERYEIKVIDPLTDSIMSMDYFSNGTWDQIYFSLRMGLINLLFQEDNTIPILLDDAFLQYDHNRLKNVLAYIYRLSKERQIILFTCQKREMEILKDYPKINYIAMNKGA